MGLLLHHLALTGLIDHDQILVPVPQRVLAEEQYNCYSLTEYIDQIAHRVCPFYAVSFLSYLGLEGIRFYYSVVFFVLILSLDCLHLANLVQVQCLNRRGETCQFGLVATRL